MHRIAALWEVAITTDGKPRTETREAIHPKGLVELRSTRRREMHPWICWVYDGGSGEACRVKLGSWWKDDDPMETLKKGGKLEIVRGCCTTYTVSTEVYASWIVNHQSSIINHHHHWSGLKFFFLLSLLLLLMISFGRPGRGHQRKCIRSVPFYLIIVNQMVQILFTYLQNS